MNIKSLNLINFRSYTQHDFNFKKGLNLIVGENGVGKTNVAEAIYYLSLARSFRGVEDNELIKKGCEFATIESELRVGNSIKKIRIVISKNKRIIFVNNKKITKLSDLSKSVNVVLFEPSDVMLFRGSPKERRYFLDVALSKYSETYFDCITKYDKVLKERNEALKAEAVDKTLLETTTEMLVKLAGPIVEFRTKYVKDINDILIKITRALTGVQGKIEINYSPFVRYDEHFEENAKEAFEKALESDLKHKATSVGIHREDFSVSLENRDIATYGSQGENRLVALALKLSPYFLIQDKDNRPIIVLDDVMSELDEEHQNRLIKFLQKFEQVFITSTKLVIVGASHYEIKKEA